MDRTSPGNHTDSTTSMNHGASNATLANESNSEGKLEDILPRLRGPKDPLLHEPKIDGDPWEILRTRVEQYDDDLCTGWTDNINSLLVLAGLLTAVVTAFAIESYRWLNPDTTEVTNALLLQISRQLSNSSLPAANVPSTSSFQPTARTIRINIVWFLSIVLGLSAALIGLLCKQWIREFQRDASIPPRRAILLRHFRWRDLQRWNLPGIMAALPILLELSVLLFFLGIIEMLWERNSAVAIPVTIASSLMLGFVILTTMLPAVLYLWENLRLRYHIARRKYLLIKFTTFSPFKSPQSWFLFRLLCLVLAVPSRHMSLTILAGWTFVEERFGLLDRRDCMRWVRAMFHQSLPLAKVIYHAILSVEQDGDQSFGRDVVLGDTVNHRLPEGDNPQEWIWTLFTQHSFHNDDIYVFLLEMSLHDVTFEEKYPLLFARTCNFQLDEDLLLQLLARTHVMLQGPRKHVGVGVAQALSFFFKQMHHPSETFHMALLRLAEENHLWIQGLDRPRDDIKVLLRELCSLICDEAFDVVHGLPSSDGTHVNLVVISLTKSIEQCRIAADLEDQDISPISANRYSQAKKSIIKKFELPSNHFDSPREDIPELESYFKRPSLRLRPSPSTTSSGTKDSKSVAKDDDLGSQLEIGLSQEALDTLGSGPR